MAGWAGKSKLAINKVPDANGGAGRPALNGTFTAVIQSVEPTTFKSGAFGVKLTYNILDEAHKGRKVPENLVFGLANGTPNEIGIEIFSNRLVAVGFSTLEQLQSFALPQDSDDFGDVAKLIGKRLMITVDSSETYKGKPQARVKSCAPIEAKASAA